MTATSPPPHEQITRTLNVFRMNREDVIEIRSFGVPSEYGKPHQCAGYFTDMGTAVGLVVKLDKHKPDGIYLVMNQCDPALLARSPNQLKKWLDPTTSDRNILRRYWLLIDGDPIRPAGISSTDLELQAAFAIMLDVRDWLRGLEWPDPVVAMSGNGYHLLYRIDLPNDDPGRDLVKAVLEATAAKFNSATVKIDTQVFNAARITKLYGTMARKGCSMPDRPHRRSAIETIPDPLVPVSMELLQHVAEMAPKATRNPPRTGKQSHNGNHRLDIPKWLTATGVAYSVKDRTTADGRTIYLLKACPFDPEHGKRGECCIMQEPGGRLSAKCQHESCAGNGWLEFKHAIGDPEPDHYDPPLHKLPKKSEAPPPEPVKITDHVSLQIADVNKTKTKLAISLIILKDGEAIDRTVLSDTKAGRADAEKRIVQYVSEDEQDKVSAACGKILVEAQIKPEKAVATGAFDPKDVLDRFGVDVLGENDDQSIVLWMKATRRRWTIKSIGRWYVEEMFQAIGPVAKEHLDDSQEPDPNKITPRLLRQSVALAASNAPKLSHDHVLGQGIHKIGTQSLVVVKGDEAGRYDGTKFEEVAHPRLGDKIIDFNRSRMWGASLDDFMRAVEGMTAKAANDILGELIMILGNWRWSHLFDEEVVAALVAATFVQACWKWRPLVSITGETDSGKSTLFDELLQPVFGNWTIKADRSTEAGLRQAIQRNSAPVLLDEFDKYKHRSQVLELFRTASRGGIVLRGTRDQEGFAFGVRCIPWFAAIESGDLWGQDRNRTIRLELKKPQNRGMLDIPGTETLRDLGNRVAAAAFWGVDRARLIAEEIKSLKLDGVHGRIVESFSVPAAMHTVLSSGREATVDAAREMLRTMIIGRDCLQHQGEPDEVLLLNDILAANVRVAMVETGEGGKEHTIYSDRAVGQILGEQDYQADLEAKGIRLVSKDKGHRQQLFLSHTTVRRELLKGTRWDDVQIDQLLLRLPGAERDQQRCGGNTVRGVCLPVPECHDRHAETTGKRDNASS